MLFFFYPPSSKFFFFFCFFFLLFFFPFFFFILLKGQQICSPIYLFFFWKKNEVLGLGGGRIGRRFKQGKVETAYSLLQQFFLLEIIFSNNIVAKMELNKKKKNHNSFLFFLYNKIFCRMSTKLIAIENAVAVVVVVCCLHTLLFSWKNIFAIFNNFRYYHFFNDKNNFSI